MALTTIPQSLLSGNLPKNYLSLSNANSDMESGSVLPWTTFSTTLSNGVPTTVTTGGTGSITIATNSTSPLTGNFDLLMTKPASNVVGTGFISGVLTIDREDLAKMLFGQLSYYSTSANIDASGTSTQSLEIWIYNVVGNYWIQPSGYRGMNTNGSPGKVTYNFQTDSLAANNQYRIAIFTAQTSALAYTIEFDSFALGPQTISNVSIRGPVGSIIATGSVTPTTGYLYANGSAISRTQYSALFAAIGVLYGAGDGSTTFNIPNLQGVFARGAGSQTIGGIVSSATLGTTQGDQAQSHQHNSNTETTFRASPGSGLLVPFSGNASTYVAGQISNPVTDGTNGAPRYGAETRPANVSVAYHICFDAGNTQLSSDSDQRTIKTSVFLATTQGIAALTKIGFGSVSVDKNGAFDVANNRYVVKQSGSYTFSPTISCQSNQTMAANLLLYKNGNAIKTTTFTFAASGNQITNSPNWDDDSVAGDYYEIWATVNVGTLSVFGSNVIFGGSTWDIKRLSGSAVVQATESVNDAWNSSAGTAFGATGVTLTVPFATKEYSSHGYFNGTTFTAGISGKYEVTAQISVIIPSASTGGATIDLFIVPSVGTQSWNRIIQPTTNALQSINSTKTFNLLAGQTIIIMARAYYAGATAPSLYSDPSTNYVTFKRVGN